MIAAARAEANPDRAVRTRTVRVAWRRPPADPGRVAPVRQGIALSRMSTALRWRAAPLGLAAVALAALVVATAGPRGIAVGLGALVLFCVASLRPGDPASPRRVVRAMLDAPPDAPRESTARTRTRSLLQATPAIVLAAEATVLAVADMPMLVLVPAGVLAALALEDVRLGVAVRASERGSGRRVLARPAWLVGLAPIPGLRRVRGRDLYRELGAASGPRGVQATRRPPVWLIGPGPTAVDGVGPPGGDRSEGGEGARPQSGGRSRTSRLRFLTSISPASARRPRARVTDSRAVPTICASPQCISLRSSLMPSGVTRPNRSAS